MLNIAITGAGPVGLTLARLLLPYTSHDTAKPTIKLTLFEKDVSATSRTSLGGTLDLHPLTGLAAVRAMNLWDEFLKHARFDGEEMRMCDQNGMVYIHMIDAPQVPGFEARPEIDRVRIMDILLASVPAELIQWGKPVSAVKEAEKGQGQWLLEFADGSTEGPFDLVVGADGAWSKVRTALTDVKPSYSGISSIDGTIDQQSAGERWVRISSMVGRGNNFSFSNGRAAMGQRMGDETIKSSFSLRRDLSWIEAVKARCGDDDQKLRALLLEEYKDWVPDFQQWITSSKDLWSASLWELPIGHKYQHKPGLVLLGDAAHLQTPFAGIGLNCGMKDALDLADSIKEVLEEKRDLNTAVEEFESTMFSRAAEDMAKTEVNKRGMFADDAPYSFFADMTGVVAKEMGKDLTKGFWSWIPFWYMVYALVAVMGTWGAFRRKVWPFLSSRL